MVPTSPRIVPKHKDFCQSTRKRTTIPDPARSCPDDRVSREFTATAPNRLRVSDLTCLSRWMGMIHVAPVIDVLARRIVGRRVPTSMMTGFVPDALNRAVRQQCPAEGSG